MPIALPIECIALPMQLNSQLGNSIGNTIGNSIGNTIGNSIGKNPDFSDTLLRIFRFFINVYENG